MLCGVRWCQRHTCKANSWVLDCLRSYRQPGALHPGGRRVDAGAVRRDLPAGLHAAWGKLVARPHVDAQGGRRPPDCGAPAGAPPALPLGAPLWLPCTVMVCACARPVSAYQPSLRVLTPSLPHTWDGKVYKHSLSMVYNSTFIT